MIITLFAWLYIFLLTAGLGSLLPLAWTRYRGTALPPLPLYLLSLLGFAVLTAVLGIYSLLAPIDAGPHLLLGAAAAFGAWRFPAPWQAAWHKIRACPRGPLLTASLLAGLFVLVLLYLTTPVPGNDDTGLYHSQTIRWLEHFAVVPGLGNLHGRLAFNSSFLQWSAFFSFSFLTGRPLFVLNGYFFLLLLAAVLPSLPGGNRRPRPAHLLTALLLVLHLDFFSFWISSPTPDIAAMLLLVFAFHLAVGWDPEERTGAFRAFALWLLALTALTVKLSTLPALALAPAGWYCRGRRWSFKSAVPAAGALLLLLAPWLIRNILQTGYFIYPLPLADIWEVDWKVPLAAVLEEKNLVHSSAIRMGAPWQQVLALSYRQWIPGWFLGHSWFYRFLLVAAAASPLAMAAYLRAPASLYPAWQQRRPQVLLWAVYYAGFIFWFTQAPSIRFGSAFLYVSALLPGYCWLQPLLRRYKTAWGLLMLALLTALGLHLLRDPVYLLRHRPQALGQRLWLPEAQPRPQLRPATIPGGQIWVPTQGVQCWYAPLPCTYLVRAHLALRGPGLAQGFRIEKKPAPRKKNK